MGSTLLHDPPHPADLILSRLHEIKRPRIALGVLVEPLQLLFHIVEDVPHLPVGSVPPPRKLGEGRSTNLSLNQWESVCFAGATALSVPHSNLWVPTRCSGRLRLG